MDISGVTSSLPSAAGTHGSLHNRHMKHFAARGTYADVLNASFSAIALLLASLTASSLASGRF